VPNAIEVRDLTFAYPGLTAPIFSRLSFSLPLGTRCLLLGANGVGKSTLLRIVAGRHMVDPNAARVLGRPAFHDTTLAGEVAFLGGPFPFSADISVAQILAGRREQGIDPARRARVMEILDVDPAWRMHRVSDGQRRRVQILLDLERSLKLVLLDEVTAELDVLARADLLAFLAEESRQRGLSVVYASHVLDGLGDFATELLFLSPRRVRCLCPIGEALALADRLAPGPGSPLYRLCALWMREDRDGARGPASGPQPASGPRPASGPQLDRPPRDS
jgi:CCR4-NOT complex subunit CAF16